MEVSVSMKVIAIAAVSGGGKTTVTKQLSVKLERSKALYFDDYDFDGPEDICLWVEQGADYNMWILSPLIKELDELLSDDSLQFILLDYPFAYLNKEISPFIDLAIFIDTPLDIAMARRILREQKESAITDIHDELQNYLSRGRPAYIEMLKSVKPNSDVVIDGSLDISEIVAQIMVTVKNNS
jgi:uridine kinase